MNINYVNPVERNDAIVKEIKERAKRGFQHGERAIFFNGIAEKYGITAANAQQLYYTRVKGKEHEEVELKEERPKQQMECDIIDTILVNTEHVRIVDYHGQRYAVARDVLQSVGIKSSSSYLNELLLEEDRIITPIPSSHGLAKTLIISLDTTVVFLEIVSMQHTNLSIRAAAKKAIPLLKEVQEKAIGDFSASVQRIQTPVYYQAGENIKVRILHIGEKVVDTETVDEAKVKGTIYIADVADVYVGNLHDFFQEGEVVEAKVKRYDERVRRLSLTTFDNPFMKLKSKYKTTTQADQLKQVTPVTNEEVPVMPIQPTQEQEHTVNQSVVMHAPHEMERILNYLQQEVGLPFISPQAKEHLGHLLRTHSLFELSIAMVKLGEQFEPDVSLLFMQQLATNLTKEK